MASALRPPLAKILELESLRGLAALLVFLHHIPAWNSDVQALPVLRNGQLMVDLFFVLSGYVIYRNYGERLRGAGDIMRFQFLRFGRLYPIHLVVLAGFALAELAKYVAEQRMGVAFGRPAFEHYTAVNLAANLTLTQSIGLFAELPALNGPSWSISTEFYTYLLFAVIGAWFTRARTLLYVLLAAASIAVLAFGDSELLARYSDILRCIAGFFLGCLTAIGSQRLERSGATAPQWTLALALALLLAYLAWKPDYRLANLLILPLTIGLILATVHGAQGPLRALLNRRALVWLGSISYSVYMCHSLVIWTMDNALRHVLRVQVTQPAIAFAAYAATIAVTLGLSHLAFRVIEKPCREQSRRFVARRAAGAEAASA